ncbi:alpha-hydroxy acid oxidase [Teichococcus oryzae]|jgi:L-lactate dehydrogenase (cytochrome)|uniref:Alpha-hydroxy-acid oxidizing protein n=1 Tax=Teichococcus oryzae TaxID=1608942 RepID=A0A5B2TF23_9PROT|nr:alpha-hydroxy acid oxidase [Pseudoroseomonas oryzae]KAA2212769.1 alpha-hydroxy-acid oxidizing protein [Pseudoroseomonas oryzae]
MPPVTNIEDLRLRARRRIPRAIFDYADRGSYDEATYRANREDLAALKLRQRVMIDVSGRSTASTMLDEPVSMPVAIAPTGLTGLFHADGEIHGCRAAHAFGIPFTLSTMSICSIEDVAGAVDKPFWFQLYVMRDRGFSRSLVERAIAAKCSALVLTLDLQIQGQRHNDIKNGLAVPPKLTVKNALDIATKPRWALEVLRGKRKTFGNLTEAPGAREGLSTLSHWIAGQFDPSLSWKDVEWIRSIWPGKLILKGVLDVEDARIAAGLGASALVVSNHGGRQLDGAPSSISMLPGIADAVGDRIEVLFDGGVRSGQDVVKALALGAKGCMIGKAWLYGLAAGGGAGVTQALEIIRKEMDVTMALTGTRNIAELTPEIIHGPRHGEEVARPTESMRQSLDAQSMAV